MCGPKVREVDMRSKKSKLAIGIGLVAALAVLGACSSEAPSQAPDTQALFPDAPRDTVSTLTIVHLKGSEPPEVTTQYIRQSDLVGGATVESISSIACSTAPFEAWDDTICSSTAKLCVYDDTWPTKSSGDLHNFCHTFFHGICSVTWAEAIQSYRVWNNQYQGKLNMICTEDCGAPCAATCFSSALNTGASCQTADATQQVSSGICLTGNSDC
jgi:hypothetical protein